MKEVIINFKAEDREGIVAVGTYLIDAAKRFGINTDCDCNNPEAEEIDFELCIMTVSKGAELLSAPTKRELELLDENARKKGQRLACEAKFEKAGEVEIMTEKKKVVEEEAKPEAEVTAEEFKKEFQELPLEKKIAQLVELEGITLSETFSFVMNSPYAAVGKVMDVLAEFGLKMEREDKEAKRPDEHIKAEKEESDTESKAKADENADEDEVIEAVDDTGEDSEEEKKKPAKKTTATKRRKTASKSTSSNKTAAKKKTAAKAESADEKKDEAEDSDKKE